MNIVFLGSAKFAIPTLSSLISSSHKIVCVVTQPDRLKGRGLTLSSTEVKKIAQASKLKIYQPENINNQESAEFLNRLNPDILVVVAFGQILSQDILAIPKILCLNLHASLLPKYRGAAPINWALIKGEAKTGVSIIKMSQKLDAGPIILQRGFDIKDSDDAETLEDRLANWGADLMLEALDLIRAGTYNLIIQDESRASFASKLKKDDGLICWDKPARDISNLIRGCAGWPGAFTYYRGKILKIHKANIVSSESLAVSPLAGSPGEVLQTSKKAIVVATGEGNLFIEELQIEGKKKITVQEFISGYKISVGEILGRGK